MAMLGRLKNRRIAILAADGFEKVELTVPLRAMQVAGADVDVISLRRGRIRGVNLHEPASRIHVTKKVEEARVEDYDGLLIPGGFINPDMLRQSASARQFVRRFMESGKPVASLCHGPWVLASAGLLDGRTLTSWAGIRDDLVAAGATWVDRPIVRDGNLLTSRGPQDLKPFTTALIEFFATKGKEPAQITNAVLAAQRDQPPAAMVSALRWMPRPSIRTLFALGAVMFAVPPVRRRLGEALRSSSTPRARLSEALRSASTPRRRSFALAR